MCPGPPRCEPRDPWYRGFGSEELSSGVGILLSGGFVSLTNDSLCQASTFGVDAGLRQVSSQQRDTTRRYKLTVAMALKTFFVVCERCLRKADWRTFDDANNQDALNINHGVIARWWTLSVTKACAELHRLGRKKG